ncbi:atpE [Symbiodinium sp. KB8]|nr:atpE [Symbiodinium sp. KB8]
MTPLEPSLGIHATFVEEGAAEAEEESLPVAGESLFSVVSRKEVEARELRKKQLEAFCEKRQEVRLSQAGAVDGIPDWLLDASSLLDEFYQALGQRSGGLERFRTVIAEAAKRLDDEEWEQFRRMPFDATHRQDLHVFSRLVADAEPHWKRLMEDPARSFSNVSRQAIVREYLYIGPDMEPPAAEAVESVFYVSQKALLVVKMKLKNEEEIPPEVLRSFSFPGDHEEDQMLIPVDLSVLDKHFPAEEEDTQELFDQFDRLNVDLIIEKLGSKTAGEVFVEAQQAFLANRNSEDPDMRAQPMSVAEWRRLWAGCEEDLEEEVLEEDQEVNEEANEGDDDVEEGLRDPSEQMMAYFQRRGWSMHRAPPVLPKPFDKQAGEADGPDGYQLAVLDLTFPCDAPQEGAEVGLSKPRGDLSENDADAAVEVLEEKGFRIGSDAELDDLVRDVLQDSAEQQVTWAPGAGPAPRLCGLPLKASGFGKIGVSRSDDVRRRLHTIQGALAEALRNLQTGGVLVASWCGLPTHPVLPFLTKQLRPGFRRVHILVPPDCVTFETYIVAAEFDPAGHNSRPDPVPLRPRESRNSLLGLEPAEMCKFNFLNWLRSPLRSWSTGYDDVLAWTLNFRREIYEECLPKYKDTVVNDVRADAAYDRPWLTNMPAKSHVARSAPLDMEARFDEMWSIYATKLGLLMNKLEPHSLDPELMPEKPPYRFNATTSWSVPRPILPPAELVILPQRKQMTTEGVPEERSESKVEVSTLGSKSTPSKSRSRSKGGSKEHSKRGRTKSKESGKIKSGACETLPNDSSTSSEKPTAGISASEISGSSSATAPTSAIPIVLEQEGVSEEPPVAQTADGKLEPPGDAAPDPGSGNDGLTAPANPQDPEIDLFEELPQPVKRHIARPQVAGRAQCTMWMSSTLGAAPGTRHFLSPSMKAVPEPGIGPVCLRRLMVLCDCAFDKFESAVLLSAAVASAYATFPLKSQAMGLSHTQRAEVLSAYPLLYLAMLFPAGAVCDRIEGARLAMALGLAGLASSAADVSSAALVAAVAGTRLGYMEGVLESCEALGWILGPPIGAFLYDSVGFAAANCIWGLLAAGLVAPVLHLATPGVCKLLEEEPESADNGEVQTDADLVSYARLLIRLSAQGSPIFAYGACSGAMYSGLALHNRAIGTQRSALLQLLVAVSYLVAAPVVGRQCDECAGDWAALSKKLAMGWAILFVGFGLLATDAGIPSMALGLLLLGLGEAFVLLPSYPRLTLECPHRPGLVSAVFNGMWALGQASGPFILALVSWSQAHSGNRCKTFLQVFT